jgi:ABC-type nitrate/sulfonate/bicarbonate transport system substrate-binding protein
MSDYSRNFALEVLWGKEDYLAGNAEAIRRFLAAMDDTAQWIRTSPDAPAALARFIGFNFPEGPDDVREALKEVHYPTVAEHKARRADLLQGLEPLADDAIERSALKAATPAALVEQLFDPRYVN